MTLASAFFATPPTGTMLQTLRWDPAAYPNGPYGLRAVLTLVAGGVLNSNAIPITIRHP